MECQEPWLPLATTTYAVRPNLRATKAIKHGSGILLLRIHGFGKVVATTS
jgi:hypothetical protein